MRGEGEGVGVRTSRKREMSLWEEREGRKEVKSEEWSERKSMRDEG